MLPQSKRERETRLPEVEAGDCVDDKKRVTRDNVRCRRWGELGC